MLVSLLDKSMLRRQLSDRAEGEPRFVMLETLREYALERVICYWPNVSPPDIVTYYVALANKLTHYLDGPQQLYWISVVWTPKTPIIGQS